MFRGRLTQSTLRALDWFAAHTLPPDDAPERHRTGSRGEEAAYFYLRRRGYTMIARNYRSPNHRGELDLVGWDKDVLCIIEVKTRTKRDFKPAEAAVDRDKQRELSLVAREFLRHLPQTRQSPGHPARGLRGGLEPAREISRNSEGRVQWRFDVLAVYYEHGFSHPLFELFQNAFSVAYNR